MGTRGRARRYAYRELVERECDFLKEHAQGGRPDTAADQTGLTDVHAWRKYPAAVAPELTADHRHPNLDGMWR